MIVEKGGALVVGGSGGLGSAIVRRLAADWEYVDFTYRSNAAKAEALMNEVQEAASLAMHSLDISDEEKLAEVLAAADRRSGGLRAVVYASGVSIQQPYVSQIEPRQWEEVINTELMGFVALVRQAIPVLRRTQGCIVNIGSVAPHWYVIGDALSSIPKAGTEALCRAVAKEEGRYGIRANTVAPGIMEVGIGGNLMETIYNGEIWAEQKKRTPLRRFGTGEDIAGAAAFLCSSEAGFITGQTIIADGGLSL
ncbi:SDR family NAD(P)-dependent oxidoreductase [Rhizorhapis sp.]|uniref:SDR family NAD(P)-dependent oxidoreductase n=1 Tax=Rhizorhapis sp. TaxID=1968842 RepID=UPI002B46B518|nr:SDR family oxidoreductase [Rhizorhapis sp.]HKR17924.1 SDR family oxidoreductase [Rhizorhapis sp.]